MGANSDTSRGKHKRIRTLLVTPPMSDLNAPYPATPYLTGYLRSKGYEVAQADASLALFLKLYSKEGMGRVLARLNELPEAVREKKAEDAFWKWFMANSELIISLVEPVVRLLQGRNETFCYRVVAGALPEGPFRGTIRGEEDLGLAFGSLGITDHAIYLATNFVFNIARLVQRHVDSNFNTENYGQHLSDEVFFKVVEARPTLVDEMIHEVIDDLMEEHNPDVVGLTIPFSGNLLAAFRMSKRIRASHPNATVVMGGGWVNTTMRSFNHPELFNYAHYVTVDDGERPMECILEMVAGTRTEDELLRTFVLRDGKVELISAPDECDVSIKETGTPTYDGLPLEEYVSKISMGNLLQRMWTDGRWNHLTAAHGCYWRKCSFCDVSLPYVGHYDPAPADLLIDRMEAMMEETGQNGFHFVDEAAPPALLRTLSRRLIERKVPAAWWSNIRFEKSFTPDLVELMAEAGCVAVTGGLEIASDRLLRLVNKGVTVEQVARVARAFHDSKILVHAYLMYGFPTQTDQEIVDSLEIVRQMFEAGCLSSGFWHRFKTGVHSPVGMKPELFQVRLPKTPTKQHAALQRYNQKIRLKREDGSQSVIELRPELDTLSVPAEKLVLFENNIPFEALEGCDPVKYDKGLRQALIWYMHGVGLEDPLDEIFKFPIPPTTIAPDYIAGILRAFYEEQGKEIPERLVG